MTVIIIVSHTINQLNNITVNSLLTIIIKLKCHTVIMDEQLDTIFINNKIN